MSELPDEAVEAAAKEMHARKDQETTFGEVARAALEAAAPYIRAQVLEEAADKIMGPSDVLLDGATCRWNAMELREAAAVIRKEVKPLSNQ